MTFPDSLMNFNFGGRSSSEHTESSKAKGKLKSLLPKRERRRTRVKRRTEKIILAILTRLSRWHKGNRASRLARVATLWWSLSCHQLSKTREAWCFDRWDGEGSGSEGPRRANPLQVLKGINYGDEGADTGACYRKWKEVSVMVDTEVTHNHVTVGMVGAVGSR